MSGQKLFFASSTQETNCHSYPRSKFSTGELIVTVSYAETVHFINFMLLLIDKKPTGYIDGIRTHDPPKTQIN